jgi:hypothetical protein
MIWWRKGLKAEVQLESCPFSSKSKKEERFLLLMKKCHTSPAKGLKDAKEVKDTGSG